MIYSVNPSAFKSIFAVPSDLVDKHIRLANEHQLKVLLWILKNSPDNPDINAMCAALKINKDDAADYLQYWVLTGMLTVDGKAPEKTPVYEATSDDKKVSEIQKEDKQEIDIIPAKPSHSEIATRIDESPEIGYLFNEAQIKLGKTIGYDGQCTLLLLHDHYGLPAEVLFMLIEYCVSVGKTNYSYIAAVGKDWGKREIDTLEKAAEQIAALNSVNKTWRIIAANAGLSNPRPTTKQVPYLRKWSYEMKFSDEMIILAYEEMANHTGKLSFSYIDKVMTTWYNAGYKTPEDVERGAAAKAAAKTQKPLTSSANNTASGRDASYDLDEFEQRSLHGTLEYKRKNK